MNLRIASVGSGVRAFQSDFVKPNEWEETVTHYVKLAAAAENGFAQAWKDLVDEGIPPAVAFARCQSQRRSRLN
jgi:hypothetical protein